MRTLYRKGDREEVWGIKFDYAEFDDSQVDAALADGWVKNPLELKQQGDHQQAPLKPLYSGPKLRPERIHRRVGMFDVRSHATHHDVEVFHKQ